MSRRPDRLPPKHPHRRRELERAAEYFSEPPPPLDRLRARLYPALILEYLFAALAVVVLVWAVIFIVANHQNLQNYGRQALAPFGIALLFLCFTWKALRDSNSRH